MTDPPVEFQVSWHIDLDAESERAAAEKCWEQYFSHDHMASSFEVVRRDDPLRTRVSRIDMHDPSAELVRFEFTHQALHAMAQQILEDGGDAQEIVDMLEKPWKWKEVLTEAILRSVPGATVVKPEGPDLTA